MPLFDPLAPKSEEAAVYLKCKEVIASIDEFWELADVAQADAATRITIGPSDDPWDGEAYTVQELEEGFGWAHLRPPDEDSLRIAESKGTYGPPEKAGTILLDIRRQVRQSEFNDTNGRQDAYLFFMDRTDRIVERFIELVDLVLVAKRIRRLRGPLFNPRPAWKSQGVFIWTEFVIEWGNVSQE